MLKFKILWKLVFCSLFFFFNYHFSLKCGKSNLKFKKLCFIHCDNASDFSNITYTAFFPDYIFLFLLSRKCFNFFIFKFLAIICRSRCTFLPKMHASLSVPHEDLCSHREKMQRNDGKCSGI